MLHDLECATPAFQLEKTVWGVGRAAKQAGIFRYFIEVKPRAFFDNTEEMVRVLLFHQTLAKTTPQPAVNMVVLVKKNSIHSTTTSSAFDERRYFIRAAIHVIVQMDNASSLKLRELSPTVAPLRVALLRLDHTFKQFNLIQIPTGEFQIKNCPPYGSITCSRVVRVRDKRVAAVGGGKRELSVGQVVLPSQLSKHGYLFG